MIYSRQHSLLQRRKVMHTAICAECDRGWYGPDAHQRGYDHVWDTQHEVWFDDDNEATQQWEGVFEWAADGLFMVVRRKDGV